MDRASSVAPETRHSPRPICSNSASCVREVPAGLAITMQTRNQRQRTLEPLPSTRKCGTHKSLPRSHAPGRGRACKRRAGSTQHPATHPDTMHSWSLHCTAAITATEGLVRRRRRPCARRGNVCMHCKPSTSPRSQVPGTAAAFLATRCPPQVRRSTLCTCTHACRHQRASQARSVRFAPPPPTAHMCHGSCTVPPVLPLKRAEKKRALTASPSPSPWPSPSPSPSARGPPERHPTPTSPASSSQPRAACNCGGACRTTET
jgi:hypothetical protein